MSKKSNKWISSAKFKKLKKGDKVVIRYMIGDAVIAEKPCIDFKNTDILKQEVVAVHFISGPWKDRTLSLIRQQIATSLKSFPNREVYKSK